MSFDHKDVLEFIEEDETIHSAYVLLARLNIHYEDVALISKDYVISNTNYDLMNKLSVTNREKSAVVRKINDVSKYYDLYSDDYFDRVEGLVNLDRLGQIT